MTKRTRLADVWGIVALLSLTACQPASSHTANDIQDGPPRYEVSCAAGEECHESVALLVGLSAQQEPTRCTAALIGPQTAVTAGHCVAWELSAGGRCDGVWLGFAQTSGQPTEWIGCERIHLWSSFDDTLLAPDYAVLRLRATTERSSIPLDQSALNSGEVVRMISVTPDRFYDDIHQVRSRRCVVDDSERSSPWSPVAPPTVRVLSSCPIRQGNSGAPLLDHQGRLRGIVHAGGPPFYAFGLMTESSRILKSYQLQ